MDAAATEHKASTGHPASLVATATCVLGFAMDALDTAMSLAPVALPEWTTAGTVQLAVAVANLCSALSTTILLIVMICVYSGGFVLIFIPRRYPWPPQDDLDNDDDSDFGNGGDGDGKDGGGSDSDTSSSHYDHRPHQLQGDTVGSHSGDAPGGDCSDGRDSDNANMCNRALALFGPPSPSTPHADVDDPQPQPWLAAPCQHVLSWRGSNQHAVLGVCITCGSRVVSHPR